MSRSTLCIKNKKKQGINWKAVTDSKMTGSVFLNYLRKRDSMTMRETEKGIAKRIAKAK